MIFEVLQVLLYYSTFFICGNFVFKCFYGLFGSKMGIAVPLQEFGSHREVKEYDIKGALSAGALI